MTSPRAFLALVALCGALLLPSCSVFLAGSKMMSDSVAYIVQPTHYVHSDDEWGTDMFGKATNRKASAEFRSRQAAWRRDLEAMNDDTNRLLFNYDKNNPYIH